MYQKFFSPIFYACGTFFAVISFFFLLITSDKLTSHCSVENGVTSCYYSEQNTIVGILFTIGYFLLPIIILSATNIILTQWEQMKRPRMLDHIRQVCLLYVPLLLYIFLALQYSYHNPDGDFDAPGGAIIAMIAMVGIIVNALYLLILKYRSRYFIKNKM